MNPQIASHGRSFKGAWLYYLHDKQADTRERIDWAMTENMLTEDPDLGWKVMAYTAKHQSRLKEASGQVLTGQKTQKPVMAYSLNWHPDHKPDKEHMLETARASMKILGLEDHEAIIVAHRDTRHHHVHLLVNRIHPETGLINTTPYSKQKLSEFALGYARKHGIEHLAPQRSENAEKRQKKEPAKYCDPAIRSAWQNSDSGRSFAATLAEHGYTLAQGRKRIVVVDPYGKTHNPVRHLEGVKAKDFNARLKDLDTSKLQDADAVTREVQAARSKSSEKAPEPKPASGNKPAEVTRWDEWVAERINETQLRHHDEQAALSRRHDRIIHETEDRLTGYYRLREQQKRLTQLKRSITDAKWWQRLLGITARQRQELGAGERSLANAQWRYKEQLEPLRRKKTEAMKQLIERQTEERELQLKRLHAAKPSPGRFTKARGRVRTERRRDGPEHER